MTNITENRKSRYNRDRSSYLSKDCSTYCYEYWNEETHEIETERLEVGKDGITEEWLSVLDELDHLDDLNERYENELLDPLWKAKTEALGDPYISNDTPVNPLEKYTDKSLEPEVVLFPEKKIENPEVLKVRRVIEEQCSEIQKIIYYYHFGQNLKLTKVCLIVGALTGKTISSSAMTNRKNKIIAKVAKELGVTPVKRHKYPKKSEQ